MAVLGRLEPFAIVSFRPETVIGRGLTECPLVDQKAVIRANFCGAQRALLRLCRLPKAAFDVGTHLFMARINL